MRRIKQSDAIRIAMKNGYADKLGLSLEKRLADEISAPAPDMDDEKHMCANLTSPERSYYDSVNPVNTPADLEQAEAIVMAELHGYAHKLSGGIVRPD
ncbi:MAG: hypothetical protein KJ574_03420 [Nanoarchaeota archaeon]|nr:hypothetical protein [Nanoarchaeota archaeon]